MKIQKTFSFMIMHIESLIFRRKREFCTFIILPIKKPPSALGLFFLNI
jgi:hypothetical protein